MCWCAVKKLLTHSLSYRSTRHCHVNPVDDVTITCAHWLLTSRSWRDWSWTKQRLQDEATTSLQVYNAVNLSFYAQSYSVRSLKSSCSSWRDQCELTTHTHTLPYRCRDSGHLHNVTPVWLCGYTNTRMTSYYLYHVIICFNPLCCCCRYRHARC